MPQLAKLVVISLVMAGLKLRAASISGRLSHLNDYNLRAGAFRRDIPPELLAELKKVVLNILI